MSSRFTSVMSVVVLTLALTAAQSWGGARTQVLEKPAGGVKFDGVTLVNCLDFLRDVSGANIHVNWKALEAAGVGKDTVVTLKVRYVTLRQALNLVLTEAGGGDTLAFTVEQNVIEVTTRDLADKKMYTRVFAVDDLLLVIPDFEGKDFNLQNTSTQNKRNGGGNGGGGGGGLFDKGGKEDKEPVKSRAERADDLVTLIRETIRPDIWRENGGPASIRYYNGNLIVTAPASVLEAIGG